MNLLIKVIVIVSLSKFSMATNEPPFQIDKLTPTPVIFEKVENVVFYRDVWTIFTKITPMDFSEVLEFASLCENQIEQVCALLKNFTSTQDFYNSCKVMAKETAVLIQILKDNNAHLRKIFVQHRSRREIAAIGSFAKWAFSTMDSEDSHKIYNRLKILHKNSKDTFQLVKHQITVVKSNYDRLIKPINQMLSEVSRVTENVQDLSSSYYQFTDYTKKEIASLHLKTEVNELIAIVTSKLLEIQSRQSTEISILNDLYQKKLHPFILDSENITNTLQNITLSVRQEPVSQDFSALQEAAKVSIFPSDRSLVIKVVIPLPDPVIYNLLRVHPIATVINNKWDLIQSIQIQNNIWRSRYVETYTRGFRLTANSQYGGTYKKF